MKNAKTRFGLVAGLALVLAACGGDAAETAISADGTEDKTSETFAAVLGKDPSLSIAAQQFEAAGLTDALDGEASYTVFVPTNAAFQALGEQGSTMLEDPQYSAIVAAVLRSHMVPGVLDIVAIDKAIVDAGGEAAVANFGGGVLTLAREEGGLVVREASGSKASIDGKVTRVGKGALIAIDTVLVDPALLAAP
jgi:uncharacterized surface protein with fasciclin (FAS1) repeats